MSVVAVNEGRHGRWVDLERLQDGPRNVQRIAVDQRQIGGRLQHLALSAHIYGDNLGLAVQHRPRALTRAAGDDGAAIHIRGVAEQAATAGRGRNDH